MNEMALILMFLKIPSMDTFTYQKIPYSKMIGVTPYSDGIEVHRDGANVKRLTFQGFDSWFLMNVISQIANM